MQRCCCCSDLVEDGDIDGLDLIFELHHLVDEIVNADLLIFNDTTHNEFVDSVGNGFLLVVLLPDEAVHIDGDDLLEELVEVGLSFVGLHVEEDEGLSNDCGLCLGLLGLLELLLLVLKGLELLLLLII